MKKILLIGLVSTIAFGCMTEPKIESTKPWEGHCYTVDELKSLIEGMVLDKNESIWIMSNTTLNRLLKNTRK